ncbi:flagellar filament capping protein FliD [Pseudobacillus wudalianchiensis]|uniref:Flagellar hook-associated protein 2 n=1 Tax=Pseudobacillus wudalianchiensis TaxID=1743143 RepID=A0A1B9AYJ2_9BACI|nr:flagellar filament capping protein FliD [Bacillus wudalianchiensis]OCA89035.1 flagellar hook protein [Bacillus wudalianchiensis]
MVRIGGLASGMDIDQMVKDLMKAERMPLNKIKQKKQVLEWQRDDYRAMNLLLQDFRSELTQMKLTTKYRARTTASTDEARVTATASSAASQSSYSIEKVEQLASAATRTSKESVLANSTDKIDPSQSLRSQQSKIKDGGSFGWSQGVVDRAVLVADGTSNPIAIGLKTGEEISTTALSEMTVKVDGKVFNVVGEGATLGDNDVSLSKDGKLTFKTVPPKDASIKVDYVIKQKVDTKTFTEAGKEMQLSKAGITVDQTFSLKVTSGTDINFYKLDPASLDVDKGTVKLVDKDTNDVKGEINLNTGKISFIDEQAKDTIAEVTYTQEYSAFSITSQTSKGEVKENFLINSAESMNQIVNKVNSSNAGVSMFFDTFTGNVSLTRTETGKFGNTTGMEIQTDGDFMSKILKFSDDPSLEKGGQNAVFTINGLSTERNSNTFQMNGVTFTLKQEFKTGPTVSVSINNDSSKVFDNIKEFVNKYNELIDKIQKKTGEERYRSYTPLSDEQREQLSDKQQELWEEKAKSGLLRRDPLLGSVLNNMRMNFSQPVTNDKVSGLFNQMTKLGITTSANYLEGGKLEISETKLRKAIEEDPESIENFFRGDGTTDGQRGIMQRLYDTVKGTMDQLKEKAGGPLSTPQQFAIGRTLKGLDTSIDSFEKRLVQVEDRYWRQFTAMEKAIQRSNQQSMYLMNQFSSGQ